MTRDIVEYEKSYDTLPFERHQVELRRAKILEFLASNSTEQLNIVEVGCGENPLFVDFSEFASMTVVEPGPEFSSNALKLASVHTRAATIEIVNAFLEELSKYEQQADIVVMSALLHEVPDASKFLRSALKLGRPGCKFLVLVPNAESLHRQLALRCNLIDNLTEISEQQNQLQQARTYTTASLRLELEAVGLFIESSETIIVKPFTHAQMQGLLDNSILSEEQLYTFCQMEDLFPNLGSEIFAIASLEQTL